MKTSPPAPTLQQLFAYLHAQAVEMAALRAAVDSQSKRIAEMKIDIDVSSLRVVSMALGYAPVGKPN